MLGEYIGGSSCQDSSKEKILLKNIRAVEEVSVYIERKASGRDGTVTVLTELSVVDE